MAWNTDIAAELRQFQIQNGLGKEIARRRHVRRWSQERLGVEAEIDHSLISRIESGQRCATRWSVRRIAGALAPDDNAAMVALMMMAGYMPADADRAYLLKAILPPNVYALWRAMESPSLDAGAKTAIASAVESLIAVASIVPHGSERMDNDARADTADRR